jgi:hypothetical protein
MRLTASLSAKLLTAFTIMIALVLTTAGVALLELRKSDHEADEIASNVLPTVEDLGAMSSALNTIRRLEYGVIHGQDQAAKEAATGASQTAKAATELAQQAEGLRAAVARFTT